MTVNQIAGKIVTAGAGDPAAAAKEIKLVIDEIDDVTTQINAQLKTFKPEGFRRDGTIQEASFGGGERAGDIGSHHTRAHNVMYEVLKGVELDLDEFTLACKEALAILEDIDLTVADDTSRITEAVTVLNDGALGDQTDNAYDDARNNPVPEETAPGEGEDS